MKHNLCHTSIFIFSLVFLSLLVYPAAAEPYTSYNTCNTVYIQLQQAGFLPEQQVLVAAEQQEYPYNTLLTFPAASPTDDNATVTDEEARTTVVLVISYEDFTTYQKQLIPVLKHLQEQSFSYTIQILIPAANCSALPQTENEAPIPNGIAVFVDQLYDPDETSTLILQFSPTATQCIITPGSGTETAPSWLIKTISDSCDKQKVKVNITSGSFPSLYHFNLFEENLSVSLFLQNQIPCAAITLPLPTDEANLSFLQALETFFSTYDTKNTIDWDRHYTILSLPHYTDVIIKERVYVFGYLYVAVFSLLVLCGLSFFVGKNAVRNLHDFIKHWYHIPITVFITALALQMGEWATLFLHRFIHLDSLFQLELKILLSVLLLAILFMVQFFNRRESSIFLYSFHLSIISIINIFIFSAIDFSLFLLFAAEYIAVAVSRHSRKLGYLIFSLLLMGIPFIPYILVIWQYAQPEKLKPLIESGFLLNVLYALALQPIFVTFFKIFLRLMRHRLAEIKRLTARNSIPLVITTGCILAGIAGFFFISSRSLTNLIQTEKTTTKQIHIQEVPPENLIVNVAGNSFLDEQSRIITIQSAKPAVRYSVTLSSPTNIPIYDSITGFVSSDENKTAQFIIPDGPPQHLTISFIAANDIGATLTVTAWYADETDQTVFTKEVIIKKAREE